MKACYNLLIGCAVALLSPILAAAQQELPAATFSYNDGPTAIRSNVPLNEINSHAYRHFQRLFPNGTSNEYWFASGNGYQVSFQLAGHRYQAYFDKHGAYRYSLFYFPGKEIPRIPGDLIKARYPDYRIDVVTEITDGEKTFQLVRIIDPTHIKTLSVCDGKIEALEELTNDSPATAAPLILLSTYP